MTKTLTTRSLLLAGALAFAALPALAQTAPSTQPAAPAAGTTVTTPADTGKSTTDTTKPATDATKSATGATKSATHTTKSHVHSKKIAAAHAKSKVHTVSAKKPMDSKIQKPAAGSTSSTGGASGTGTADPTKKP
ncbi:MAG TPA: hypothetical protein VKB68_16375 [Stellaceae bacterium]|nr:hypothetical protein [Stellaceae bacterium]